MEKLIFIKVGNLNNYKFSYKSFSNLAGFSQS